MENQEYSNNVKKKLLYVCDYPLWGDDAPSLHVLNICKAMSELEWNVTLLAPSLVKIKRSFNFFIVYLPAFKKIITLLYQPSLLFYYAYFLLRHRPKLIYIRQSPFLFLPILLGRALRFDVFLEVNGDIASEARLESNLIYRFLCYISFFEFIENISYWSSTVIIVVTEGIKEHIVNKYSINIKKIRVIHNGVDTEMFRPMEQINRRLELQVGYVGGIVKWQGLDYLINAVPEVIKKVGNIKFIIVGDGDQKLDLIKLTEKLKIDDKVIFWDKIYNDQVPSYINSFDICISYPTKYRNGITSPFKIYEYLSCGKPVVASDISGVGDKFNDVCVIAKAEDSKDLAEKIIRLATDEKLRKRLSLESRKYILDGCSWLSVAKQIDKCASNLH